MTCQPTPPVRPADAPASATSDGALQRIALRRSVALSVAVGMFVLTATLAVYVCFASRLGAWQAIPLTVSVIGFLALCGVRHERAQPAALKITPDGLSAWDRTGKLLVQGRIAGCSHWSDRLLVLVLRPEAGHSRTLLLAADALPAAVFRELAVLGRRGAGA